MNDSSPTAASTYACGFNRWVVGGFAFVFVLYVLFMNVLRAFDHDELEAIHTAWKILQGDLIYVDFLQHHHPLLYFYLAPVIALFGEHAATVVACRVAILPFFIGIIGATYLLAVRLFDKRTALVAVASLLLSWPFVFKALEVRPDVPQVMLGMFALVMLYPGDRRQDAEPPATGPIGKPPQITSLRCFVIGICLGISFLFLQKAIFYIAGVTLILLGRIVRREARWSAIFTMGAGIVIAIAPFGVWIVAHGMVREYFFLNWTLNVHSLDRFSFVPFAMVVLQTEPILCAFALLALIALAFDRRHGELAVMFAVLFCQVPLAHSPYLQYWMPALPLVAVYAAHGLMRLLGRHRAIIAVLLAASAIPSIVAEKLAGEAMQDQSNLRRLGEIDYVLNVTGRSDAVFDGEAIFNIFRKDVDYFWFGLGDTDLLGTYRSLRGYDLDICERIERVKPKVICTVKIDDPADPRIRDHYVPSDRYPALLIRSK